MVQIARKGSIPKAAVMPTSIQDVKRLFEASRELNSIEKKILLGMGPYGLPTRILYKKTAFSAYVHQF